MDAQKKKLRDSCYKEVVGKVKESLVDYGFVISDTNMLYDNKVGCSGYGFRMWMWSSFCCPMRARMLYSSVHKSYYVRAGKHYAKFDTYTCPSRIIEYFNQYTLSDLIKKT